MLRIIFALQFGVLGLVHFPAENSLYSKSTPKFGVTRPITFVFWLFYPALKGSFEFKGFYAKNMRDKIYKSMSQSAKFFPRQIIYGEQWYAPKLINCRRTLIEAVKISYMVQICPQEFLLVNFSQLYCTVYRLDQTYTSKAAHRYLQT